MAHTHTLTCLLLVSASQIPSLRPSPTTRIAPTGPRTARPNDLTTAAVVVAAAAVSVAAACKSAAQPPSGPCLRPAVRPRPGWDGVCRGPKGTSASLTNYFIAFVSLPQAASLLHWVHSSTARAEPSLDAPSCRALSRASLRTLTVACEFKDLDCRVRV